MTTHRPMRALILALVVLLTLGGGLASSMPLRTSTTELLQNGGFEGGFTLQPGCGFVGNGWNCFNNGGTAAYGFYDDQWDKVVYEGDHSQLIEINTKQIGGDPDRYAGIYQRVAVVPGALYHFSIKGMIRADDHDPDPWRYRVQVAFDHTGNLDWTKVEDWIELPWDTYYPRTAPGDFSSYETDVVAKGSQLTVFVRVWKKWGDWYRELDVNLDQISLTGPAAPVMPAVAAPPAPPVAPPPVALPVPAPPPTPAPAPIATCTGPNLVHNGDFEDGFYGWGVGYYWGWFHNGGQANYGFYDDQWDATVYSGDHSQLIEINTLDLEAADADRYAGIYQIITGLQPGVTYELSLAGMMREEAAHPEEDAYRYRVQWGYLPGANTSWTSVTNWQELPWDTIYVRTSPGEFMTHKATFVAPSSTITLFIRAWKKWPTTGRELDVNLDAIALRACTTTPPQVQVDPPAPTVHKVRRGEYLAAIAARYGTTVQAIARANGLRNPNWIYVGQKLIIPVTTAPTPPAPPPVVLPPTPSSAPSASEGTGTVYVVQRGDTLYAIAVRFKTTPYAIAKANGLRNLNWIYVGQKLVIPTS